MFLLYYYNIISNYLKNTYFQQYIPTFNSNQIIQLYVCMADLQDAQYYNFISLKKRSKHALHKL